MSWNQLIVPAHTSTVMRRSCESRRLNTSLFFRTDMMSESEGEVRSDHMTTCGHRRRVITPECEQRQKLDQMCLYCSLFFKVC